MKSKFPLGHVVIPIPVRLRRDFLRRLGSRDCTGIVAVLWHRPCVLVFNGVSFRRADNERVFDDLCKQLAEWLDENRIRLKPARGKPSHWLLLDLTTGEAFAARSKVAEQVIVEQNLPKENDVRQKRLF